MAIGEYYNRQGEPISQVEWGRLIMLGTDPDGHYGENSYKRIGEKHFEGGVWVSTVWMGIDHRFTEASPPIIFETMVFGGNFDNALTRYCTEQEAIEGHARTCDDIENGRPLWFEAQD